MRSRLLAIPLALACLLTLAPTASAAVSWVVNGRGFGHGVGMSAYGAYGYAKHGKNYRFILGHYYTGTTVEPLAKTRVIRVLLGTSSGDVEFSGATSACRTKLDPRRSYEARRIGNGVRLRTSGGKLVAKCGAKLRAAGAGKIAIAGYGTYRGALEASSSGSSLYVVNALALEQYAKGVMPNEVPPSWPTEQLKAQAVAVRSIALTSDNGGSVFDVYPDTRSQVYEGLESEYPQTNAAVEATKSQVLMYRGQIATAFYSACSGGHTESVENVFGTAIPYLVGVPDPYDYYCPLHKWTLDFSGAEISSRLGGSLQGKLKQVVITKTGLSPRIISAKLVGTGGTTTVTGSELSVALGGYDTWMTFQKVVSGKRAPAASGVAAQPSE
jgi:stage II sporulation protein D